MKRLAIMTIIAISFLTIIHPIGAQIKRDVLDASLEIGSGGYNRPVRSFRPAPGFGNLYITGNMSDGKSFRGRVGYSDPTKFQGNLGSSTLDSFDRDSTNLKRVELGEVGGRSLPFYSRSSTILPLSAIKQHYNEPGSSLPRSQILPHSPSYLTGATLSRSYEQSLRKELPSSIRATDILLPNVGIKEPQPGDDLYDRPFKTTETESPEALTSKRKLPQREQQQMIEELEAIEAESADASRLREPTSPSTLDQPEQESQKDFSGWLERQAMQMEKNQILIGPQQEYAESAKRLAVQGKDSKSAPNIHDDTAKSTTPNETQPIAPVVTMLAGKGRDDFNSTMRNSQKLMNQSRFYDAYYACEAAHSIKPDDPLPLFGQTNAMLAAGDFRHAANILKSALKKFPKFLYFDLKGSRLLGSKTIIKRRRSQLETLMQHNDDPNLKLIAGYLELLAGNRDKGFTLINASGVME